MPRDPAAAPSAPPAPAPFRFDARSTLTLLTVLNFINYVDRYVLAAVLERIKLDPAFTGVSDARLGLLQSVFLVVYMVASPAAGLVGQRLPRRYLVAFGVGLWSLATIASGLAHDYGQLLAARAFIGFGEAGYATVAPAIISDLYSRERRGRILSIFYLATPVGSALGFVVGGTIAEIWSWRDAFFVCGGPGLLLAVASLWMAEPRRGAQDPDGAGPATDGAGESGSQSGTHSGSHAGSHLGTGTDTASPRLDFLAELKALARNGDFVQVTLGGTLLTFSIGGLAFWIPTWLQEARHLGAGAANQIFGGIAVVSGIVGTFAGGYLGDAWARRDARAYRRLSGYGALVAAPFAAAAPFAGSLALTFALMFAAMLLVFLNTGPLNTALVNCTPPRAREFAVGMNILCIHLLGDAISPPLLGALSTALAASGQTSALALGVAVSATALPLFAGAAVLLAPRFGRPPSPPFATTKAD